MTADEYCELCELPLSTCVHGAPPPPPPAPAAPRASRVSTRTTSSSGSASRSSGRTPGAPAKPPVVRRWTPPDVLKPHIVAALEDAGGELDADALFLELEVRLEDQLTASDREKTPEGELRWQYAARRARQALVAEGLMTKGRPGVWALA
ncbi:hypothetical protein H5V45_07415 [Nocardioides sp. KIGAM211]|uniref:Restriction system protein Mrr-like N-terminal domain-containing protein n=1 Tax=Nocardioides luti TaxID=2761101 RepID=A0A7X0VAP6_9ACTN|nr:hypothetical protein [Nocardioides luti]MBB6627147.1 hypothetical protein [Nocardioides luti]